MSKQLFFPVAALEMKIKGTMSPKMKNPLMLTESRVKFHSPKNISGASQQNSVAAFV